MTYTIGLERGDINFPALEPLYRRHYAEMQDRLEREGHKVSPFSMQVHRYFAYWQSGQLLNFVARFDGAPVGYANVYLDCDMHNGDPIAQEDAIYVVPGHRKGIGRKITLCVLDELRLRGIKRAYLTAATDPRAESLWHRLGFKRAGSMMIKYL